MTFLMQDLMVESNITVKLKNNFFDLLVTLFINICFRLPNFQTYFWCKGPIWLLGFNLDDQQWLGDYFYLDRSEVRGFCETVRTAWDSERMGPEHCQASENCDGNMTNISTRSHSHHLLLDQQTSNGIRNELLSSPHTLEDRRWWNLLDFLRRWSLFSWFEIFEGTKKQVKISGRAPWGIQSLCRT